MHRGSHCVPPEVGGGDATEISPAAVAIARKNVERLGVNGRVLVEEGDLFEPISRMVDARPFNLIVSNPPYIPSAQIETLDRSVREYEPVKALDGGADGWIFIGESWRRLLSGC